MNELECDAVEVFDVEIFKFLATCPIPFGNLEGDRNH